MSEPHPHARGVMLVTASAVAWSTAGLFTRLTAVDAWTLTAWRGILGAAALTLVMAALPGESSWRALRNLGRLGWFFVLQSSAGMIFFVMALRHTTVAHVAVMYATVPFFAAGLGWLGMRERPGIGAVLSSALALIGVAVMVGFGRDGGLFGDLLALGMTLTMAVAMVIARHFRELPFLPASALSALLSGLIAWPFGAPLTVPAHDFLVLALFGATTFAVGLPLFTLGARHLPPIETALIGSLDAPLAPLWVWWALDETPSSGTLIGASVVFGAVGMHLVLQSVRARKTASAPDAPLTPIDPLAEAATSWRGPESETGRLPSAASAPACAE